MAENPIVLDSGALSALATGTKTLRVATRKALNSGARIIVPTVVVAESTTTGGPRDAGINRIVKAATVFACDITTARSAAALRFSVGSHAGIVDAIVVATADQIPGAVVLTGDGKDLTPLAAVRGITGVVDIR